MRNPRPSTCTALLLLTAFEALAASSGAVSHASYSPPIQINSGGTYTGNWESLDPNQAAVQILTTQPVVIENCSVRSRGDLIATVPELANVTIRNCTGFGLDPMVAGKQRGSFFFGWKIGSLNLEHNYWQGVAFGVKLWGGDGWSPTGRIDIRFNKSVDGDGLLSDGQGGRVTTNLQAGGSNFNSVISLAGARTSHPVEIAWNDFSNAPFVSAVGDVINVWRSNGSPANTIEIHDNFIQGGYSADPFGQPVYDGAGITMDGTSGDTASTATAFVRIHDNQMVHIGGAGIAIAAGHDNQAFGNRVVSTGQLPDGRFVAGPWSKGITIGNCVCYNQPATTYFNNFAHDNVSGLQTQFIQGSSNVRVPPAIRQDYSFEGCEGGPSGPASKCVNNLSLPEPLTEAMESHERLAWHAKLREAGYSVGPTPSPSNYSDLWWDPNESGWGLNLVQHAQVIFGAWYTYDAQGSPRWYVMPGGRWTSSETFAGELYGTTGPAASSAFDATRVRSRKFGTAVLAFPSQDQGSFAFEIDGVVGTKSVRRQPF